MTGDAAFPISPWSFGLSRATMRERIARTDRGKQREGEIVGSTVVSRADTIAMPVRGVMLIEVEGRAADRIVDSLAGFPEVSAVHTTNERWGQVAERGAASLTDLDLALRRIRHSPGILDSETNLLLATPRSSQARLRPASWRASDRRLARIASTSCASSAKHEPQA